MSISFNSLSKLLTMFLVCTLAIIVLNTKAVATDDVPETSKEATHTNPFSYSKNIDILEYEKGNRVVAVVGSLPITLRDLQKINQGSYNRIKQNSDKDEMRKQLTEYYNETLNFMISIKSIEETARLIGMKLPNATMINEFYQQNVKGSGKSEADFLAELDKQGMTKEMYQFQIESSYVQQVIIQDILSQLVVTSNEDIALYNTDGRFNELAKKIVVVFKYPNDDDASNVDKSFKGFNSINYNLEELKILFPKASINVIDYASVDSIKSEFKNAIVGLDPFELSDRVLSDGYYYRFVVFNHYYDIVPEADLASTLASIKQMKSKDYFDIWLKQQQQNILIKRFL